MTRSVPDAAFGTEIVSMPSFGVFITAENGKVAPLSVETRMLTVPALIGAAVVPATFHVTGTALAGNVPPTGAVTAN